MAFIGNQWPDKIDVKTFFVEFAAYPKLCPWAEGNSNNAILHSIIFQIYATVYLKVLTESYCRTIWVVSEFTAKLSLSFSHSPPKCNFLFCNLLKLIYQCQATQNNSILKISCGMKWIMLTFIGNLEWGDGIRVLWHVLSEMYKAQKVPKSQFIWASFELFGLCAMWFKFTWIIMKDLNFHGRWLQKYWEMASGCCGIFYQPQSG